MSMAMDVAMTVLSKGSLLLGLGALAVLVQRRSSAAGRHLIWMLSVLGLVLLPVGEQLLPSIDLAWLPQAPKPVEELKPVTVSTPQAESLSQTGPVVAEARQGSFQWTELLFWCWAVVTLGLWSRQVVGIRRLRQLKVEGKPFDSADLRRLTSRLGLRAKVRFMTHARAQTPCTWGVIQPVVLLPESAVSWTESERRDVIVHELAHVQRLDWLSNQLARWVCALFFFQPWVWWATARMAREAELACDDQVLSFGASAPDYAERLLGFARGTRRDGAVAAAAALQMARSPDLSLRIAAILDPELRRKAMSRIHIVFILAIASLLVAAIAPSQLVHAAGGKAEVRDRPEDVPLLGAAEAGDLTQMKRLIEAGEPVNVGVRGQGTPLIQAAMAGHRAAVELLLRFGADVNLAETEGPRRIPRTPLGAAAVSGDPAIAQMMLAAGAELEKAPRGEASPLMLAARTGQLEMVEVFLDAGADANRAIRGDGSVLIRAAAGGNPEVVARVLQAGADPNRAVRGDGSPLIHAASRGDVESVKLLLAAGADPNKAVPGDGSPLIAAGGNTEIVDLLVAAGARVDGKAKGDGSALIRAAGRGDLAMVERLLDAGADPDGAVEGDGSPLIRAAASGHSEVVDLLLNRGASIDLVVPGDENPLIQAAWAGQLSTVKLLIARGADVNREVRVRSWGLGFETRSPLTMARKGGHDQVVDLLLRSGARE